MNRSDEPLDITKVLEHYGANHVPQRQGWGPMKCLFHEDRQASASVSVGLGAYKCQACDAKGNAITLIQWKEGCDYAGAISLYEEITGASYNRVRAKPARIRRRALSEEPVPYERSDSEVPFRSRRKPLAGS